MWHIDVPNSKAGYTHLTPQVQCDARAIDSAHQQRSHIFYRMYSYNKKPVLKLINTDTYLVGYFKIYSASTASSAGSSTGSSTSSTSGSTSVSSTSSTSVSSYVSIDVYPRLRRYVWQPILIRILFAVTQLHLCHTNHSHNQLMSCMHQPS